MSHRGDVEAPSIVRADRPSDRHPRAPEQRNIFLDVLDNPTAPLEQEQGQLERLLLDRMEAVTPDTCDQFFRDLAGQIGEDPPATPHCDIITRLSLFLAVNTIFVESFARTGLLAKLDLTKEILFDPHVRMLCLCMSQIPASVTAEMVRVVCNLSARRENALKLMRLMAVFLERCDNHPERTEIFRAFLDLPKAFLVSEQYIYFAFLAVRKFPELRDPCINALAMGLISDVAPVARAAHAAFCHIQYVYGELPITEMLQGMNTGYFPIEGVQVLARMSQLPISRRLIQALMVVGSLSRLTVVCLVRFAAEVKGAELLVANALWMRRLKCSEAFLVFLAVSQHPRVRDQVMRVRDLPVFLARVAEEGNTEELDAIVPVIRCFPLTDQFIRHINAAGFFESFFPRAIRSSMPQLKDAAALLVDKLARITWVEGFRWYIQELPAIFSEGELSAQKGLVAALVLAAHPKARPFFSEAQLVSHLEKCQVEPNLRGYRENLLRFLRAL
jgi:hypothetical protein